ncbi:hypothetical protein D3C71_2219340 [compost metagenome]
MLCDGFIRVTDQAVDLRTAQRTGIFHRQTYAITKLRLAPRQASDATLTRDPIPGRQVL